jgi:hypothetical protein
VWPTLAAQDMYPFERFTEQAKKTLTLAQEEAERSQNSYIGTEHLLLGLMRQQDTIAAEVLRELGIKVAAVRETIESVLGRKEQIVILQVIPTSRVKRVIEIAFEEAGRRGQHRVEPGHLLAALVIEGDGIAAHVLEDLGATRGKVIDALERKWGVEKTVLRNPPKMRMRPAEVHTVARFRQAQSPRSEAETLHRLLLQPHVSALLLGRGLDVAELADQLSRPPDEVVNLRSHMVSARSELADAAAHQDYERAARMEKRVEMLTARLQRAEADWFEKLRA